MNRRYDVIRVVDAERMPFLSRVLASFATFEQARQYTLDRLASYQRRGLNADNFGVITDRRSGHYLFRLEIESVN